MRLTRLFLLASTMAWAFPASADALSESFNGPLKLHLNLYAFAADVDGSIGKGGINYDVDQPFKDTLKHLDAVLMAHAELNKGRWGLYIDKQLVKTSESKNPLNIPVGISTKLEQTSYGIYYQAYRSEEMTSLDRPRLVIEPTLGVHHTEARATLQALGRRVKGDVSWREFFYGARARYNFDSSWNLAAEVTTGNEDTISAHAYVGYNLPFFERHLNLRVGYRYFKQNYKSNDFHWDVRQRGPVIGISLPIL